MKRLALYAVVTAMAFAAGFQRAPRKLAADLEWSRFSSHSISGAECHGRYDVAVQVEQGAVIPGAAVRVYCNVLPPFREDYIGMQVEPDRVSAFAVEAGVFRELASCQTQAGSNPGELPRSIRLRHRPPELSLVCDGRALLSAVCRTIPGGMAGVGATAGVAVRGPFVQQVEPVSMTDDFMRAANEASEWQIAGKARWEVRSLDNPARSSNAFIYQGWGAEEGASLVGRPYWDGYQAEVSALGDAQGVFGLVMAAEPAAEPGSLPERCCLVRWSAAGEDGGGSLEIVQREPGGEQVLASRPGGFRPGQWYRLAAQLDHCWVRVMIDGREMLSANSPWFSGGMTGLLVRSQRETEFDDFRVAGLEGACTARAVWQTSGGAWQIAGERLRCRGRGSLPAFALTGQLSWANMRLEANIEEAAGRVGLVVAFQDPANYVACELLAEQARARLVAMKLGQEAILAEGPWDQDGLRLTVDRGYLCAGGLTAFLPDLRPGRVGIVVAAGSGGEGARAELSGFRAIPLEPPRPVVSINEIFDDEELMKIWSGTAGDWKGSRTMSGEFDRAFWHRALFFGDAEIEAVLPQQRRDGCTVALSLGKPLETKKKNNGYILALEQAAAATVLKLMREDEECLAVGLPAQPLRVRFRRAGPFLLGYVDDRLCLQWQDPLPLDGPKVAWAARGMDLEPESVQIYSRALFDYSFNRAAADWRRAGGVWQVVNRWECDPRWSFMAGMPPAIARSRAAHYQAKLTPEALWTIKSIEHQLELAPDPESKLAALWHKGVFSEDFVIDCFVAPLHQQQIRYKNSVRDFCLTICGDGRDLASGYNFIFGGWDNTRSAILRQGVAVRERHVMIPAQDQGSIHRMWFRLHVERIGGHIEFSVHTQPRNRASSAEIQLLKLEYDDAQPLGGGQVAIWTYDSGLLVARCRMASANAVAFEDPLVAYPTESPCIYSRISP